MLNITADQNGTISWVDALRFVNETAADQRNSLIIDFLQSAYAGMRGERIDLGELEAWCSEQTINQIADLLFYRITLPPSKGGFFNGCVSTVIVRDRQ